ncbi:MAG: Por secretion system protein [Bacteroidales bacterium]|nr:Por secretion system protein [Bacteroidales bacterium]
MKRYLYTILILCAAVNISCGQVIECSPEFPAYNTQNVVITFHADKGTAGLKGFSGDVYAHTGVIMKNSSSWTNVKYDWAVNKDDCKLTRTATNTYTLTIPSVQEFYGLSETEAKNVDKLAFVFRSADGKKEGKETGGKDIFMKIYEPSALNVKIVSPLQNPFFVNAGENVEVEISVSNDKASVSCNGETFSGNTYKFTAPISGVHTLEFKAEDGNNTSTASLTCVVRADAKTAKMPEELHRGVNKTDFKSATFVLYAPGKKSAYVTGDFNDWSITEEATMAKDGDYFFCTVGNLDADKEYAYQFIVDETIRIADPYTEKILDPFNDKYIPATVYPNLTYPDGKADGIVSTFRLNRENYNWKNKNFEAAASKDLIIYELLIRDFTKEGSIKAVTEKLDYLQKLGINAIELMPFSEFEGNDSWGYNPSFYFAADKAYGTANDYKKFIDECHGRGIAVIQDIVLNHSYGQSPLVQLYYNKNTGKVTADNPWYNVDSPNTVYSWGYDFNHESDETKALTDSIMAYWMTEYNVDGFRFDFTKGFTNKKSTTDAQCSAYDASRVKILQRIYDKIKSIKSSAIMICEHLTDNSEEKELAKYGIMLWGNSNYAFCQSTMGYSDGSSTDWAEAAKRGFDTENLVAYAESHDEERMMYKTLQYGNSDGDYSTKYFGTAINRMKGAAAILLSIPGPKMI